MRPVAKSRPKTSDELCTLIESLLAQLPNYDRAHFWILITNHKDNWAHKLNMESARYTVLSFNDLHNSVSEDYEKYIAHLRIMLAKHRKPKRNAERDAEIMRLHGEEKTGGEIVRKLIKQYPKLNDKTVRAVISRNRNKK
jgi:hypothetical protein